MGMMVAGSLGLLRGGKCPLLALLPFSATTTTATTTDTSTWLSLRLRDEKKVTVRRTAAAPPPLSLSIFPDATYGGVDATRSRGTSPLPIIRNAPNTYNRPELGWKCCCFCTAPSSSSSPVVNSDEEDDDDDDDEITKIKETANTLDIRVGKILKAWGHDEADSLFVEEVDVGEPEPRIICSGLVKYLPLDHLQGINVVVLANLKPRNMRGVKSLGMLMAASDALHENMELLVPPEGSVPGQRIWFGSVDEKGSLPNVASPNQIQKKKIWELVQPHLRTDESCIAALGMHTMRTTEGVVVCRSLKNARIS